MQFLPLLWVFPQKALHGRVEEFKPRYITQVVGGVSVRDFTFSWSF